VNSKRAISDSRASLGARPRGSADDFIQVVEGLWKPSNVLAVARFAQLELGAPPHNLDAVLDKTLDDLDQPQLARSAR